MNNATDSDLIERLGRLGTDIDGAAGDTDVAGEVIAALGPTPTRMSRRPLAVAAAVLFVVALGTLIVPDTRRAVARWFGLDGVEVEVEPGRSLPPSVGVADEPGPGESRIVDVDGRAILISAISANFDDQLITKTVGASDQLQQVQVNGSPGLWIGGESHEVLYRVVDSDVVVERVAANTLLWNDTGVLYRIEGFDLLEEAVDYAEANVAAPADD